MSSHHIVKEKQEPALYIHYLGLFDHELLGQLLEWSPTVIVAANEYETALSLGLKIDIVIGDEPVQIQDHTKWIPASGTEMQTALNYLVKEKYPAVNIISQENKFDDFTEFLPVINIVLFTEKEKAYAIKSGFSIWKPAGTLFKIDLIAYFETTNLKQQQDETFIVINDGFVSFEFTVPYLFLSEFL
jgi:thiamine pyrophosphokinase